MTADIEPLVMTDTPHSRFQTKARVRHPRPAPIAATIVFDHALPHTLRRKLRAGAPGEIANSSTLYPLALYRRAAEQQVQAAGRADSEPMVREQRRQREEVQWAREGEGGAPIILHRKHRRRRETPRHGASQHLG